MELYIGLMSGTSMDGIDAALVQFDGDTPTLLATHGQRWPVPVVNRLHELCTPGANEIDRLGRMDQLVAIHFAQAVKALLAKGPYRPEQIRAIGSHGQTIRHRPEQGFTLQIGHGARLAVETDIDVICDFRMKDVALGGQGAPLVPAFHQAVFGAPGKLRFILNIGGIANISVLPGRDDQVLGFDTGPGNTLMDLWYRKHKGGSYDPQGSWAASGFVSEDLLGRLMKHPFLAQSAPKSTGRETFTLAWLELFLAERPPLRPEDVQRTLLEFTARTIVDALLPQAEGQAAELFICGGGIHNRALMLRLYEMLPGWQLDSTEALGLHPDWVEAIAFAWLAKCFVNRQAGNLPAVTGAKRPAILGCLYPAE
ncbi:anhydro-N-acetylmuramic acid kinase [Pseudaeromonas sp. ZJS20]|uniref:anhydro-N-acetylmuramic acid kinase n=1 Tax=Pseudaeromonas aegiceratis TaxID=3153928 RepID=UPI00390CC0E3